MRHCDTAADIVLVFTEGEVGHILLIPARSPNPAAV